jgi:transcription initiation factor TFIID TATA-box-binding protein
MKTFFLIRKNSFSLSVLRMVGVPKEANINIVNVVASVTLNQTLDLNSIVKAFPEAEYRPEQFPGVVLKLQKPKVATLIFSTGKMVCVGSKSERQAKRVVRKVVQELKDNGILIMGLPTIRVVNIVASASLGRRIDIEKAAYILGKTIYEPEQFPGLIYRMDEPKVVLLLYTNGGIVVTGAKTEYEVYEAVNRLREKLMMEKLI